MTLECKFGGGLFFSSCHHNDCYIDCLLHQRPNSASAPVSNSAQFLGLACFPPPRNAACGRTGPTGSGTSGPGFQPVPEVTLPGPLSSVGPSCSWESRTGHSTLRLNIQIDIRQTTYKSRTLIRGRQQSVQEAKRCLL